VWKLLKLGFLGANIGLIEGMEGGRIERTEHIEKSEKEES
jgi:hypothetical protein